MLPERDGDFAGKKALDGPGVKHFASSPAIAAKCLNCVKNASESRFD
jgi:hypothetical protein